MVNRRVLVVAFAGFLLAGAVVAFLLTRSPTVAPEPAVRIESPVPPPAVKTEPKAEPVPPSPAPAPRTARRAPAAAAPADAPPASPDPAAAAPDAGVLRIDSDVPGAQVFIDRVFLGATPITVPNVKPGTHRLNVSAPGFDGVAETLEVVAGPRDIMVKLKDVRLEATIAVVHKHRIGSCRGQLVASPQGLRYETAEKDDAFSVPLRELETFQIDYLEKNLKLKLQKGKRFEFTDPEGNSDRLFVFHRDVEKARDRLKKGDPPANP
ncbi:MAG: PEGA domain-containing protein [Acidobacteriota bacterium]